MLIVGGNRRGELLLCQQCIHPTHFGIPLSWLQLHLFSNPILPPPRRFLHGHYTLGGPLIVISFMLMRPLLHSLSPASISVLSLPPESPDGLELQLLDPTLEVEDQ